MEQHVPTTTSGSTHRKPAVPGSEPLYVVHLYTTHRDLAAAFELAADIAKNLADNPAIYPYSTTVGLEDDPNSHQQVFVDQVTRRSSR